ncbi:FecR family protein [Sphingobacterium yanglingense]|uniref:FecR family protein n=1 Tax=Sphingobacterium yanglingense TaxID=1437280 RepID=A0A4R6WK48_9SPHI|nr:FecR domain-containing protein [Sphingobacterium yanglingense]TDQ79297.1 FecR family protein [Sphingobacterium yanglingense]
MEEKNIKLLFDKYLNDEANTDEIQSLYNYFGIRENDTVLLRFIQDYLHYSDENSRLTDQIEADQIVSDRWIAIADHTLAKSKVRRLHWIKYAAAIVVFCSVAIGLYIYSQRLSSTPSENLSRADQVVPGSNKATLTFADGAKLALDGSKQGIVIGEELTYSDGSKVTDVQSPLLVLSTPKGGQYQVTLSDGTKVYLNAMTTLTYPQKFAQGERRVQLSGEAYFEVSHDAKQPFVVKTDRQEVRVLGTVFNTHAYPDEGAVTTTLLRGKVKLSTVEKGGLQNQSAVLNPGEQGTSLATAIHVSKVDAAETIAWKNGKFVFDETSIPAMMRQIERWYDVETIYSDDLSNIAFSGSISRYEDIKDVLRKIELTNKVKISLEGRRIRMSRK